MMISIKSVRLPRSIRTYFLQYTTYSKDHTIMIIMVLEEYFGTTTTTADRIHIVVLELLSFDVLLFF